MTKDQVIRLIVIGDTCVGKTSIIKRYTEGIMDPRVVATIGFDFKVRILEIGGRRITVQVWDTAGQERFCVITKSYLRGADGIILCFDVTNRFSFDHVRVWMESIEEGASETVQMVLIGNKIDLDRLVSEEEGNDLAEEYGIPYFETSAKEDIGIDEAFDRLTRSVLNFLQRQPRTTPVRLTIERMDSIKRNKFCKC
jgi:small GTP-binding protein